MTITTFIIEVLIISFFIWLIFFRCNDDTL
jgi:hypothetical protein